jgi:hypothetical protein
MYEMSVKTSDATYVQAAALVSRQYTPQDAQINEARFFKKIECTRSSPGLIKWFVSMAAAPLYHSWQAVDW